MEVELLLYNKDEKGSKKGTIDFKIVYSPEKWEIFRNVAYFEKENRKWLSIPNTKRDEAWLPVYERAPSLKNILEKVLEAMSTMVDQNAFKPSATRNDSVFEDYGF